MKLILIRHLKTPGNEKRQYIGSTDEELSEQEVLNFKQKYKIDSYPQVQQVIVSPMKRCIQTAELIYPEVQIQQESLLKECDFGIFECKTYEELKDRAEYQAWLDSGGTIAFPEGEEQKEFRSGSLFRKYGRKFLLRLNRGLTGHSFLSFMEERLWRCWNNWRKTKKIFIIGRWKMAEDIECLLTKKSGSPAFTDFMKFKNWEAR